MLIDILQIIETGFPEHHILVIGDVMLDEYIWSDVCKISPEAPIPVAKVNQTTYALGGAGNVAANLHELGIQVSIIGTIGTDNNAAKLIQLFQEAHIDIEGLLSLEKRVTSTKTRIIAGHQQLLRIDSEDTSLLHELQVAQLKKNIELKLHSELSLIILSDYLKGSLPESICHFVIKSAQELGIPVLVDPKGLNYQKYKGATAITPNQAELVLTTGVTETDLSTLIKAAEQLRATLSLDFMVLTLGEKGIAYIGKQETLHYPAVAQKIFDVTGAGDTVIAVLGASMASGMDPKQALELANQAAGIVVSKVGAVPIKKDELIDCIRNEISRERAPEFHAEKNNPSFGPKGPSFFRYKSVHSESKILDSEGLTKLLKLWKNAKQKIVFTNGCFDLLHAGHVSYLEKAKLLGDRLVIGLNSDASVRKLKGSSRPITSQEDRSKILASLSCVDAVVIFEEESPLKLISFIKPDILVKGNDYKEENIVGAKEVRSWGGDVQLIPLLEGRSTTQILKKIHEDDKEKSTL